MLEQC